MEVTSTKQELGSGAAVAGPLSQADDEHAFLAGLGCCVRDLRQHHRYSRRELSERCGVSPRFIAQLEAGEGNISIVRLRRIADALDIPLEVLVARRDHAPNSQTAKRDRFALIGLRGAGKSTLGRLVAERLGLSFVELNAVIEERNGLGVSEIFALYGEERYRQMERECLEGVIADCGPVVVAVAGGIVEQSETYRLLLDNFTTIWLRASPDEHMARVLAQGDRRPVAGHPAAMDHLHGILRDREAAYSTAHHKFDTSGKRVESAADDLAGLITSLRSNPDCSR